jgi:hypothetical protein
MAQQRQDKTINAAVELLLANGFDGLAEAVTTDARVAPSARLHTSIIHWLCRRHFTH